MTRTYSIRNQLLAWISAALLLTVFVALPSGLFFATDEISEVYDVRLVNSARAIAQVINLGGMSKDASTFILDKMERKSIAEYEEKLGFRIWLGKRLIAQSSSTFSFFGYRAPAGFSDRREGQWKWRLYVLDIPQRHISIEISERSDIRDELTMKLMTALTVPWIFVMPAIFLMTWFGVRKSLKPVIDISADVDSRASNELSPIDRTGVPIEVSPLIRALNRLFRRMEDSLRQDREFTDHAAHELRTPLAAMKTQTQVLLRKSWQTPDCRAGLENLHFTIDRSAHLVDQLLALAQIQYETCPFATVNLSHCIYASINEVDSVAAWKNIAISMSITDDVHVIGHQVTIMVLLKNLLDNAVKYTPRNGQVSISLTAQGVFVVADTGPGLSDQDKKRVFGRFVRADRTGETGSGLGLAMVQQIASMHGVEVMLFDGHPQGLVVEVAWHAIEHRGY